MTFVPVVPHVPTQEASPRTRELGDLLGRVIEEYEKHHPSVTGSEVRGALQIAAGKSKAASQPAAVAAVLGLLFLLVGIAAFFFVGGESLTGTGIPWTVVTLVVVSVLAVAIVIKRLAGR